MIPHHINLRGPWDYSWTSASNSLPASTPASGTVKMPQDWQAVFGECSGTAQFRRKFHCPTNLEPHERVILAFTGLRGTGHVTLNQSEVGSFEHSKEAVQFEITQGLKPFNELVVEITFDPRTGATKSGGLYDVVRLEIHGDAPRK